jgi:RNA polymerase sigma-70 factor, ECF subfamily
LSNLEGRNALPAGPPLGGGGDGTGPVPLADPIPGPGLDADEAEDREWVGKFQAGKEEGFNRLVLKHKDRIFGLCLRLLAGNREDAEDAAQETFVKVFHALAGFRMDAKFSTWLYRIAVNTCKNKLVSAPYRQAKSHRGLEAAESDAGPSAPSPSQELDARRRREAIESAIARLPEEQRTLVVLRDIEGLSYEEIAASTGLNPGTLKSRLNRGRGQLQEWLRGCLWPALPTFLLAVLRAGPAAWGA